MAFHVVCSFLLRVLASKSTLWMAEIFQQPIRCFYFMVSEANTRIKKEDTTWKAMKSWARKCYIFLCTINFEVTWSFWKMCKVYALVNISARLFHSVRWPCWRYAWQVAGHPERAGGGFHESVQGVEGATRMRLRKSWWDPTSFQHQVSEFLNKLFIYL